MPSSYVSALHPVRKAMVSEEGKIVRLGELEASCFLSSYLSRHKREEEGVGRGGGHAWGSTGRQPLVFVAKKKKVCAAFGYARCVLCRMLVSYARVCLYACITYVRVSRLRCCVRVCAHSRGHRFDLRRPSFSYVRS